MALQGTSQAALRWVRVGCAAEHHIRWDLGGTTQLEFFKLVLDLLVFFVIVKEIIRWDCFAVSHGLELLLSLLLVNLIGIIVALLETTEVIWRSLFGFVRHDLERILYFFKSFWWRCNSLNWCRCWFERIEEVIWTSKIDVKLLCVQCFNLIILLFGEWDATKGTSLTVILKDHSICCLLFFLGFTDLYFNLLYNWFLFNHRVILSGLILLLRHCLLVLEIQLAEWVF